MTEKESPDVNQRTRRTFMKAAGAMTVALTGFTGIGAASGKEYDKGGDDGYDKDGDDGYDKGGNNKGSEKSAKKYAPGQKKKKKGKKSAKKYAPGQKKK